MVCNLLKMSVDNNNNRYYNMTQKDDIFIIEHGRVGAKPMVSKRPMSLWKETYDKHIKDGYVDRTNYITITSESQTYKPIEDVDVKNMVEYLMSCANETIQENYSVTYKEVSKEMCDDAQEILYQMVLNPTLDNVRQLLPKLFVVIPRKMKDVKACLPDKESDIPEILQREQELLDLMLSEVVSVSETISGKETILDANHLQIELVTDEKKISQIKSHMGEESGRFVRAFRVRNEKTDANFYNYCKNNGISSKDIHYYYHGSKNMCWWSIMKQGQKLNPKAPVTGKMFGYGLYYANLARKSIGYCSVKGSYWAKGRSDTGYLAVYKVAYKNALHVNSHQRWMTSIRTTNDISGHDALFAHGGIDLCNDEIIIYNESQATLQYLIEIK